MDITEEELFIETLRDLGMTGYESEVYYALFQLKYATIHELQTFCTVPRNKIYETLNSLEEKGFAVQIDSSPLKYARTDIEKTFIALRRKEMEKLDRIERFLKSHETVSVFNRDANVPRAYELHSDMAIERHMKTILQNTRTELYIGVSDPAFFNRIFTHQTLKKLEKKIHLHIILRNAELGNEVPYRPCYLLKPEYFRKNMPENPELNEFQLNSKITLISDRHTILNVDIVNSKPVGSIIFLKNSFFLNILLGNMKAYLIPV